MVIKKIFGKAKENVVFGADIETNYVIKGFFTYYLLLKDAVH